MSEASGQRPSVASYEPRHQRHDPPLPPLPEDPFVLPDPVAEQLRRWRAERESPSTPTADDADSDVTSPNGHTAGPAARAPYRAAPPEDEALVGERPVDGVRGGGDERADQQDFASPDHNGHVVETAPFETPARMVPQWHRPPADGSGSPTVAVPSPEPPPPTTAASSGLAIEARNLHKKFKDMVAVEDVSFTVPAGSIVALLGPNGAGKTTTVNMLCTLLKPDGGTATVNGHDVAHDAASVRKSIMLTGQFAALDEALTGRENLVLFGRLLGLDKSAARARADELLDAFSLTDVGGKRVREYSGGMRRRIDIACGLVTAPRIVFLDEPTTGLDPRSRLEVWSLVEKLRDSGVTILLTTQYLEEADVLSDNIVVIDKGRVIAEGTSDELKASTGAAYCEVTPADPADRARLRDTLADLIAGHVQGDDDHFVAVPAPDGPETLVEVIRRTAAADIPLSDVAMRRPSLDEVFLALTDPRRDRSST
ncbi:ATP-binding cassette domain-containing protein [Gordonia terrae]|uniref:ATP-binding cassette domain-containing protein n=1 Tax=Gordonia hongkongensis TaxID=1701090 RepID=UPI0022B4FD0D|nr:ATP-binding cassette domain-containing protein [Gordonia terrae]